MLLKKLTSPPVPSRMIARLGTAMPGTGLRFDAIGRACPPGQAVTYVAVVASTAVRLMATATASAGTPY